MANMTRFQFEKAVGGEFRPLPGNVGRSNGQVSTFVRKGKLPKRVTVGGKVYSAHTWGELAVIIGVAK